MWPKLTQNAVTELLKDLLNGNGFRIRCAKNYTTTLFALALTILVIYNTHILKKGQFFCMARGDKLFFKNSGSCNISVQFHRSCSFSLVSQIPFLCGSHEV